MNIFVDTSALLAIVHDGDAHYQEASACWKNILGTDDDEAIITNYVLVETSALIQRRHGTEKTSYLYQEIVPALNILWVTEHEHNAAMAFLFAANRRNLSLVDCSSFETMRRNGIQTVFTFDEHFKEQGFTVIP